MKILCKSQFAYALDTYDKKLASLGPKCKAEIKLELRFLSKFKNFSLPVNAIYRLTHNSLSHQHLWALAIHQAQEKGFGFTIHE